MSKKRIICIAIAIIMAFVIYPTGVFADTPSQEEGAGVEITADDPQSQVEIQEVEQEAIPEPSEPEQPSTTPVKQKQTISCEASYTKYVDDGDFLLNASAATALTYKSSNNSVLTVSSNGLVHLNGVEGSSTITITAQETDDYYSTTKTVNVTVNKRAQTISGTKTYSVTVKTNSLTLKLKAPSGSMSYTSSNTKLATVSASGVVTLKHKNGTVKITAKASETSVYTAANATVTIKINAVYKAPSGKIGEACQDERGKAIGGKAGDQRGNEVKTSRYVYSGSKKYRKWKFVIRLTDPAKAEIAAQFVQAACANNNIGYDNYKNSQAGVTARNSLYNAASKVGFKPSKIKTKVDTSCTPLCMTAIGAAGINTSYQFYTSYHGKKYKYRVRAVNAESLKSAVTLINNKYKAAGQEAPLKIISLTPAQFKKYKSNLKRGDVLCTGSHTAMVL
ncbi:MAG: hypothetical protein IJJ01_12385 [Firmicutes bacterium]|nr:hypothetical protein [Bacillota bacterium]